MAAAHSRGQHQAERAVLLLRVCSQIAPASHEQQAYAHVCACYGCVAVLAACEATECCSAALAVCVC